MLSARREFLEAFLGAIGVVEILDCVETSTEIRGTGRLAPDAEQLDFSADDEDDVESFFWRIEEEDAPPLLVFQIVDVLNRYQLIAIDTLRVSRDTVFKILLEDSGLPIARESFEMAWEEMKALEIFLGGEEDGEPFLLRE